MNVTQTDIGREVTLDGLTYTIWSAAPAEGTFHAFTRPEGGGPVVWVILTDRRFHGVHKWRLT